MTEADVEPPSPERHPRRALIVAVFVALTGPLIGVLTLLAFTLARTIANIDYDDTSLPSLVDMVQVVLFFSLFAYVFAGSSSIVAGVLLGVRTYTHGTFGYPFALGVAVVSTVVGTALLELVVGQPSQTFIGTAIFFTPFSIVSAVVGRWLMAKIGILSTTVATSLAQH